MTNIVEQKQQLNSLQPGQELQNEFEKQKTTLFDYSKALGDFINIFPTMGKNYVNNLKDDSLQATVLSRKEVTARLNNFLLYRIDSIVDDNHSHEDALSLHEKSRITFDTLKASIDFIDDNVKPIICYGVASREGNRFVFFGVQKSLNDNREERENINRLLKKQIDMKFSEKNYTINDGSEDEMVKNQLDSLFTDNGKTYYTGIDFGFPDKKIEHQNSYNDMFSFIDEEENDFTFLILAKPIHSSQKIKYSNQLEKIYKELYKSSSITKTIEKSQKEKLEISETQTEQNEKDSTKVIGKTVQIGSALINPALGALAGITVASSLVTIPIVGKKLACAGLPILTIVGACLGGHYLKEMSEPFKAVIDQSISTKKIDMKSITQTFSKEFGFKESYQGTNIDLICKSLADKAKTAFDMFNDKNEIVWQTIITYSSTEEAVRNNIHSDISSALGSDEDNCAYNKDYSPETPSFFIPDNYFRTGTDAIPTEYGNFISSKELSEILYLPTKSFDGFKILKE